MLQLKLTLLGKIKTSSLICCQGRDQSKSDVEGSLLTNASPKALLSDVYLSKTIGQSQGKGWLFPTPLLLLGRKCNHNYLPVGV